MGTANFQRVIRELASAFETAKRTSNGETFYRLRDDAPAWLQGPDFMRGIHDAIDGRFPDDWIYEHTAHAARNLVDYGRDDADDARDDVHEIADGLVDVYNSARAQWLADHGGNAALVDEACDEFGSQSTDIMERIGIGQYYVLDRIVHAVISACEAEEAERDERDMAIGADLPDEAHATLAKLKASRAAVRS